MNPSSRKGHWSHRGSICLSPSTMIPQFPTFVRRAGTPFDSRDADVVLRSQDGVDFHTFKAHLSAASSVFDHMFQTGNDGEELADSGLPIIPFYDPSPVLEALLCYCNPNISSRSSSVPLLDVHNLAMKYDMMPVVKAVYKDRIWLEHDIPPPPILDAIRKSVGQDDDLYHAAAKILTCAESEAEEMIDLGLVNQAQLTSLLRYRDECRATAVRVASPPHDHFKWIFQTYDWFTEHSGQDCCYCHWGWPVVFIGYIHRRPITSWWWSYMYDAKSRLRVRPFGSTVMSGDFFDKALAAGARCRVCKKNLDRDFREFVDLFAREVDRAVSQARI